MNEELIEMEKKVTTDRHSKGSEEGKIKKEVAKGNGKRMSQEELDKEIAEIKGQLNVSRMILEENQRQSWALRKKVVKWSKLHSRLQQKQVKWQVEELRGAELEMEESICGPKQGQVLGEYENLKTETSSETKRSHDFKSDDLCIVAGETHEEGQFSDIVIKKEEDRQNLNFALKEEDSEDGIEILGGIPSEMTDWWHELSLLEERLEDPKVSVQIVKSELNENEEVHYSEQRQKTSLEQMM